MHVSLGLLQMCVAHHFPALLLEKHSVNSGSLFAEYEDGKWMVTLAKDFISKNHQADLLVHRFLVLDVSLIRSR